MTNPEIWENLKEFVQLDGDFVISGDGFIECVGRYLTAEVPTYLPGGLGTRHSSVAAVTAVTNAIGVVVSHSGGGITYMLADSITIKGKR